MSAPSAVFRLIASIAALAAGVSFAPLTLAQWSSSTCAADRGYSSTLNCTANDIEIASVRVNNAVTSCVSGDNVTLDLTATLHINASQRYNVGVFLARDAKAPNVPAASGGSANCQVHGLPLSPSPFGDLDSNACGDIEAGTQGQSFDLNLGTITVPCLAGTSGNLVIPSVVSWDTNSGTCNAPVSEWVRPGTTSKCESGITADIPVTVKGKISITKQTLPDQSAGTFSFTASGTGVTPTTFSLSDGQAQVLATGNLGSTAQSYSVSEDALSGFDPNATIACVNKLGQPQTNFVSASAATRTLTVEMSANPAAGLDEVYCTFTNTKESSITIVKNTVGADGVFGFTGSESFDVTTSGGTGQKVFSPVGPGSYTVTESAAAGWDLTSLSCTDPSSDTSVAGATASIKLAAGENVTCTFTNTARGSIQISKSTTGGDGAFSFSSVPSLPGLSSITTSAGSGGPVTIGVAPGAYAVSETVPAGWDLAGINCTDPSGGTTTSLPTANIALAAGETVSCTFNNTKRASITVVKNTTGGDGAFTFAATGGVNFTLTTTAGTAQNADALASVVPGTPYTITETVPAGWSLQSASCRDAGTQQVIATGSGNSVTVTPSAGQGVVCTFNDVKQATLRIFKHTEPHATQSFNFSAVGLTPGSFTLSDDGVNPNSVTFANLAPGSGGTYSVTEVVPAGYVLTAVTCSDIGNADPAQRSTADLATATVTPHLVAGETLDCTFTNTQIQPGSITVTKTSVGGDGAFAFTNSGGVAASLTNPAAFSITTSGENHNGSRQLTGLAAATYTILEQVPAGWDLNQPVQCVVTTGSHTEITYVAGGVTVKLGTTGTNIDAVACQFTDVKRGSITIVKKSSPQDPYAFTFASTSNPATTALPASFTLSDSGTPPNSITFPDLLPGVYTVTEAAASNWVLAGLVCSGGSNVVTNVATGLATITLQAGENVSCTYSNAKNGTITVTKNAIGGAGGETFTFAGAVSGTIQAGQMLSGTFAAGTYSVTEAVPSGWRLSNIACPGNAAVTFTGAAGGTDAFEPGDTTANITLGDGQSAACTFTNEGGGSIRIVKRAAGGDATFSFSGAQSFQITTNGGVGEVSFAPVQAGTYTVQEAALAGWRFNGLTCSNSSAVDVATATATVSVAPGEQVTCTFENSRVIEPRRTSVLIVTKRVVADDPMTATFQISSSLGESETFTLAPAIGPDHRGEQSRPFGNLLAGTYTIVEMQPAQGWASAGVTCTDPSGDTVVDAQSRTAVVQLAEDETVQCVFDNVSLSNITVNVVSTGGTGYFGFSTPGIGPDYLEATLSSDVPAGRTFSGLMPGTYQVVGQGGGPSWQLYGVNCVGDEEGDNYWTISGGLTTIVLPHGEDITCTYYYRFGTIPIQEGPVAEIPTLSEWGMILMATLLAFTAVVMLRRREAALREGGR